MFSDSFDFSIDIPIVFNVPSQCDSKEFVNFIVNDIEKYKQSLLEADPVELQASIITSFKETAQQELKKALKEKRLDQNHIVSLFGLDPNNSGDNIRLDLENVSCAVIKQCVDSIGYYFVKLDGDTIKVPMKENMLEEDLLNACGVDPNHFYFDMVDSTIKKRVVQPTLVHFTHHDMENVKEEKLLLQIKDSDRKALQNQYFMVSKKSWVAKNSRIAAVTSIINEFIAPGVYIKSIDNESSMFMCSAKSMKEFKPVSNNDVFKNPNYIGPLLQQFIISLCLSDKYVLMHNYTTQCMGFWNIDKKNGNKGEFGVLQCAFVPSNDYEDTKYFINRLCIKMLNNTPESFIGTPLCLWFNRVYTNTENDNGIKLKQCIQVNQYNGESSLKKIKL